MLLEVNNMHNLLIMNIETFAVSLSLATNILRARLHDKDYFGEQLFNISGVEK